MHIFLVMWTCKDKKLNKLIIIIWRTAKNFKSKMADPLAEYRLKKKKEYEQHIRLKHIENKYKDLLVLDKKDRSAHQICNFVKRYVHREPINMEPSQIQEIPGIFRYRINIANNSDENNLPGAFDAIDSFTAAEDDDPILKQILRESLMDFQRTTTTKENLWVLLDLRIYGPNPYLPIHVFDNEIFLTVVQINKILSVWASIDPETTDGLRFQQYINYTKSLAKSYK